MSEPDYDYQLERRNEERAERKTHRLDNRHGRVEDYRERTSR